MRSAAELVRAALEAGAELYVSKAGELLGRGIPPEMHAELRRRRVEVVAELRRRPCRLLAGAGPGQQATTPSRFVRDPRTGERLSVEEWFDAVDLEGRPRN